MKSRIRDIFRRLALTDRIGIRRETRNQVGVDSANGRSTMEENSEDLAIVWRTENSSTNEESNVLESLHSVSQAVRICRNDAELLTLINSLSDEKVFLIIDFTDDSLLRQIENLRQIDSVFIFSTEPPKTLPSCPTSHCADSMSLVNELRRAREQFEKQMAAFSVYNKEEKATRDLTKETGSFLFFQLFKMVLRNMPSNSQAKKLMVTKCRDYYRRNDKELVNIDDFDRNYKATEAIVWYTKDCFLYRLVNKALRTEDVEALYDFRFYILDLSKELEKRFNHIKQNEQSNVLRLYRGFKTSMEEVMSLKNNIGNLISSNGYLSTSRNRQVAFNFAKKPTNRPNVQKVFVEYYVDLSSIATVIFADIAQFSKFPDEAEVLFDLGASFLIDSCCYNADEDLWFVNVRATDKGAEVAGEYIAYQKEKVLESNISLMFGHLLIEAGEYAKAEKYFNAILNSDDPNDEEIACIFHNIGRNYRLKGQYERADDYLKRAYDIHVNARPSRLLSAARTINTIGIVQMEQRHFDQAKQSFEKALKLFGKTIHRNHPDIGGTLINLADLYVQLGQRDEALRCFQEAQKIYESSLPAIHPNIALGNNNIAIFYFQNKQYDLALDGFNRAFILKEHILPADHPDLARTAHNLAIVYALLGQNEQAELFFKRAKACTLPETHPFKQMLEVNIAKWEKCQTTGMKMEDMILVGSDDTIPLHL